MQTQFLGVISLTSLLLVGCGNSIGNDSESREPNNVKEPLPIVDISSKVEYLDTFSRVAASVEHFYPGVAASNTDWEKFLTYGMYKVSTVNNDDDFVTTMKSLFKDIAPGVEFNEVSTQTSDFQENDEVVFWYQNGFAHDTRTDRTRYTRERRSALFGELAKNEKYPTNPFYTKDYGNLTLTLPVILKKADQSNLGGKAFEDSEQWHLPTSITNTYGCLTMMSISWGLIRDYWPYYDTIDVDWDGQLGPLLSSCAQNDRQLSMQALTQSLTLLQDNHTTLASAKVSAFSGYHSPPIGIDWVEDKLVVIYKGATVLEDIALGSELLAIDNVPVADLVSQFGPMSLKSDKKKPHWVALEHMLRRPENTTVNLTIRTADGSVNDFELESNVRLGDLIMATQASYVPKRKEVLEELGEDVYYLDLSRLPLDQLSEIIDRLSNAKGLIIDFRHYPKTSSWKQFVAHLNANSVHSAPLYDQWVHFPNHEDLSRVLIQQEVPGKNPQLSMPIVALSSRYSQSANEHALAFLQDAGIPIIGEETSGINGDITIVKILGDIERGGLVFIYTGLEVRQHDDTPLIGVGIVPDIKVERTLESIKTQQDNQLAFAKQWLLGNIAP